MNAHFRRFSRNLPALLALLAIIGFRSSFAGTTGKLAGRVLDDKKEPLPNAAVVIVGTTLGAVTDLDGYYAVLNIPPGTYTVQVRMVGRRSFAAKGVEITVNNTTKLDAVLEDESITTDAVVVTAQRPVVDVGLTSSVATVTDKDIKALPVQELSDIINLQAGVVDGHFRGGRAGEVQYQVNGVSVNNVFDNSSTVRIDRSLIQEVQVITGTFDAEYGQAMSGVVNTVLKSGGESFQFGGEALGGSFAYSSGGDRNLTYKFRPATTQNYQLNVSGPTGLPQTYFLFSGQRYVFDDYLYGTRIFLPTDTSITKYKIEPVPSGDGKEVPLGSRREWSGLAKLTNRSIPSVEISYQAIFNVIDGRTINNGSGSGPDPYFQWRLDPDGKTIPHTRSIVHGIDWTHTVSPSTFYTVAVRQNYFDYYSWVYDDFYDPRYDAAGPSLALPNNQYNGAFIQGADFTRYRQTTNTLLLKASVTSQVSRDHQIKLGAEIQDSKMAFGTAGTLVYLSGLNLQRIVNQPPAFPGVQTYFPISGAAYAHDMIEWNDLTIRAGVRFEFFNGRSYTPSDLANPADSIPGAPPSYAVRTTPKYSVAPRFGLSYPITVRSSVFFSYGHFYQLPNLQDMFTNANYARLGLIQAGTPDFTVMGNPDVRPERTVQYEFGYKNAVTDWLGLSVNLFYKDIRDLLGVQFIQTYTSAQYSRLANVDFGNVTGFTLSLDQRRMGLVSSTIDYTWQMAQGNSSNPQETASLAAANQDSRPRTVPFDWDQRHTLNVTVQLSQPESYSVSAVMKFASGQPYTPSVASGFGSLIETNSGRKPNGFLVDLRFEKYFVVAGWNMSLFARVFNLLDATFFNGFVYANTGSPAYSITPYADRNSLIDPTRFYPPRRIEIGISMNSPQ
jgi:outer membrane receptor protein involved in Fe transport